MFKKKQPAKEAPPPKPSEVLLPTVQAVVLGDNINTDLLHPPRYFGVSPEAAAPGFLAGLPPEYAERFRPSDILVGGRNFGCGSSRESYIRAFRYAGVGCVIAHSFSRIFYRNLINAGIPLATHPELHRLLKCWEKVIVDYDDWTLKRADSDEVFPLDPPPDHLQKILSAGGLLRYLGFEQSPDELIPGGTP